MNNSFDLIDLTNYNARHGMHYGYGDDSHDLLCSIKMYKCFAFQIACLNSSNSLNAKRHTGRRAFLYSVQSFTFQYQVQINNVSFSNQNTFSMFFHLANIVHEPINTENIYTIASYRS